MRARFRVYEVEHQGDEAEALHDLRKAGCDNIEVLSRDFEGEESIAVAVDLPEGMTNFRELEPKLEYACL